MAAGDGLTEEVYAATNRFPRREMFGLADQLRRAAVSVPSNIAEGKGHRSGADFAFFVYHARGSLLEMETQIRLAARLRYLSAEYAEKLLECSSNVARGLNALINAVTVIKPQSQQLTTNY